MAVSVARGTTFDNRAFAPYLKIAIPAQSGVAGGSVSLAATFYIAGGSNPVWSAAGLTALGLSINSLSGLITGVLAGGSGGFTITCTNSVGAYTSASTQWAVTGGLNWSSNLPDINIQPGGTFDFTPYIAGTAGSVTHSGPALPTGVTLKTSAPWGLQAALNAPQTAGVTGHKFTLAAGPQADWVARSTAAGVVWAHDFTYQAEVDNFIFASVSPNNNRAFTTWIQNDGGASGKCIECRIPTGTPHNSGWWRPFSPLNANGNGLPVADRADGLTRRTWTPNLTDPSNFAGNTWRKGMYTHNSYNPNFGGSSVIAPTATGDDYDAASGGDFYIQFKVKIQATRFSSSNPPGKLAFVSTMQKSNPTQELVVQSLNYWPYDSVSSNVTAPYRMYTNNGNQSNSMLTDPQGGGSPGYIQPGSAYTSCNVTGQLPLVCWYWPAEEWVTVMVHVKPGRNPITLTGDWLNNATNFPRRDTQIQVSVARAGATSYTTLYSKSDYAWQFEGAFSTTTSELPEGFNGFQLTNFMNDVAAATGWYQRYTEIIFSRQPIACPQ